MINFIKNLFKKIDPVILKLNHIILVSLLLGMFLLLFINVVGRYLFSVTYLPADELARYFMITLAFLGFGLAMRESKHSYFNIIQDALPKKYRKKLRIFVALGVYFILFILLVLGFQYSLLFMNSRTQSLQWPVGLWYLAIPVGTLLFIYHFTFVFMEYINLEKNEEVLKEIESISETFKGSKYSDENIEDIE
jgi:TRAP-type transport system small permease protein